MSFLSKLGNDLSGNPPCKAASSGSTFENIYVNNLTDTGDLNVRNNASIAGTTTMGAVSFAGADGGQYDVMTANGDGTMTFQLPYQMVSFGTFWSEDVSVIASIPVFPAYTTASLGTIVAIQPNFNWFFPDTNAIRIEKNGTYEFTAYFNGVLDNQGAVSISILTDGIRAATNVEPLYLTQGSSQTIVLTMTERLFCGAGNLMSIGISSRSGVPNSGAVGVWKLLAKNIAS